MKENPCPFFGQEMPGPDEMKAMDRAQRRGFDLFVNPEYRYRSLNRSKGDRVSQTSNEIELLAHF